MKDWTRDQVLMVLLIIAIIFSALLAKWDTTSRVYRQVDEIRQQRDELRQGVDNLNFIIQGRPIREINVNKKGAGGGAIKKQ